MSFQWETLVTDRNAADVQHVLDLMVRIQEEGFSALSVSEKSAWDIGLKGTYNYTDLNRVEAATQELSDLYREIGYSTVITTRPWVREDVPSASETAWVLANIRQLVSIGRVFSTTPSVPTSYDKLSWQKANDIEQILYDLMIGLGIIKSTTRRSGTFNSGMTETTLI